MKKENVYLEPETFRESLKGQLPKHRENLGLKQKDVAHLIDKPESTYQRWEATGDGLTNIFNILKVFQVLGFSTTEIIKILGLSQLKPSEIGEICTDEGTLKSIKEDGIYLYVRNNRANMDDITIEKLLDALFEERLKRHQRKPTS